jgi:hypothetical protein
VAEPDLEVIPEAPRDVPHRAPDGSLTDLGIEGVVLHRPPRHIDHRGSLVETINFSRSFWFEPVIHGERATIRTETRGSPDVGSAIGATAATAGTIEPRRASAASRGRVRRAAPRGPA